ncbi:tRNA (adenosine(37)-N6)-threonylcarbamoyltransferase complex ATPase subunit type 1 TsaE [Brachybacterium nesterenkovii]|uniref:tRNA threonylcarbamoyladenosine biosynthesis protein TsaE n=1 Tax=Brachybacterium nesterenkovii TaxID=47847 RepID=A0A1X6WX65_9MICO|nr:tRNA (adenosine(37)-N6)-threonylcarbamoyltransferase complex ATPase subunit type 1 TsaE [Brachybacterium nesterenkovii]SLM90164.1 TsaE protein, required for threonylcarbamoyladenosine t(6)A37 formation in tRNA [Brachybacterium nesterenkovii]
MTGTAGASADGTCPDAAAEDAAAADGTAHREVAPIEVATAGAEASRSVARALAAHLRPGDLIVLDGPLGAGKTTFTQGLGAALGVRGAVASPTFVISRVHPSLRGGPALVHVDAYRLSGGFDIDDLDLDSELEDAVTVVEWGRDRVEHLAASHLLIELERAVASDAVPADGTAAGGAIADGSAADGAAGDAAADSTGDSTDEPRLLRLTPHGPRWDDAAVATLRSDLLALEGTA